jgi:hypothetical protein
MKKIFVREIIVPEDAILEVATLLSKNEINNEIIGSDEKEEVITVEVRYEKHEKETIQEVIDLIDTYEEDINDEDEEDDDD